MARRSKVQLAFDAVVRETSVFCEEDEEECCAIATVEIEQLKTGQKWHYCEEHAPKGELPPRAVRREYEAGRAVGIVQTFINKHSKKSNA